MRKPASNPRIRRSSKLTELTASSWNISITVPPIPAISPPLIPLLATSLGYLKSMGFCDVGPDLLSIRLSLHDLHSQTHTCVIGNVAVNEPCAWIVCLECNDDISVRGKQDNVTTRGIGFFEIKSVGKLFSLLLLENGKVVAVQMNLMNC